VIASGGPGAEEAAAGEPVPERFRGVWRRVSLAVDGEPPAEHADVVWVQTGRDFADIRVPHFGYGDIVTPACFAGTTRWDDPHLRWSHELDLDRDPRAPGDPADADVGHVRWDGADLIESGTLRRGDRTVAYVEVWRRLPGGDGVLLSRWSADRTRILVRAGDHAVTVADDRPSGGCFRACYRARRAGSWGIELALGDGATALPAPPPSDQTSDSDTLGVRSR
jgi:hypothetical protein